MKTKQFTLACIIALFSLNLAYGRWPGVDPNAENYYPQSPYSYAGNSPIKNVDPDGRDWYSVNRTDDDGNKYVEYVYTDLYRSQRDLKKAGVDGTYIGITGKTNDGSQYLSLFGTQVNTMTANGQVNLTAEMIANLDNAIISAYQADYMNANQIDPMFPEFYSGATNMGISMNVTLAMVSRGVNVFNFSYAGGKVRYEVNNDMGGQSFEWQTGNVERIGGYHTTIGTGANAIVQKGPRNRSVNWIFPSTQAWQNARNRADKLLLNRKL